MKIFTPSSITRLVIITAFSLAWNVARADDGEGGDIDGTESLDIELAMTPTSAAPTGAAIELSLKGEDDSGTTDAELKLEGKGLLADTYTVSVTLKSTGGTVQLGTFTVGADGEAEIEFGDKDGTPFPANFNPLDIATASVANSSGVVLFTADLTQASAGSTMTRTATVQATPGPTDPNATGTAVLNAIMSGHQAKGSLQLSGHGLPANVQLSVLVNGLTANSKKVNTDKAGNVTLNIGPKGKTGTVASGVTLFQVTSLTLSDPVGNVLLSVNF
jgi:hypothetical protein